MGQQLVALKFQFDWIKAHLEEDKDTLEKKIENISDVIYGMTRDFKQIYNQVNPTMLDDLTIIDCFEFLASLFREKSNKEIRLFFNLTKQDFSSEIKLTLYKILEECLNNIIYHSKATYTSVSLAIHDGIVKLVIEDDGIGFNSSTIDTKVQHGILEVRERVNALSGKFEINSVINRGTTIEVEIPV